MKAKDKDPFLGIAIRFILGVVMGFFLFLLGFIFLAIALLTTVSESNEIPGWVWLITGILLITIGAFLMYYTLKDSPTPGSYLTN